MSQKNPPGYPLPSGELGNDDIVCQLVYLPDRDEYWQAFLGALSYMATWRAWERDDDKRGKDAAANWREAFELTLECWRMACIEELKQDVSDILALMQSNEPCCIENTTYGDQTTYITIIIPGVGDDPTHYGETAVSDWDEWSEYLCYNAHLWVDELVSNAQNIEVALSLGGLAVALMAYVFGAFNFLFMRGDLNTSTLMLRVVNMIAGYSIALFSDAADDIESAREDIVCAVINGGDVSAAVESALSSGDAWDLLYQHIDYDSAVAIMYEGGDGEDYLVAEKRDDCYCIDTTDYTVLIGSLGTIIDDGDDGHLIISPQIQNGCWRAENIQVVETIPWTEADINILSIQAVSGGTCDGKNSYRAWDYPSTLVYNSNANPGATLQGIGYITLRSGVNYPNLLIIWEPA